VGPYKDRTAEGRPAWQLGTAWLTSVFRTLGSIMSNADVARSTAPLALSSPRTRGSALQATRIALASIILVAAGSLVAMTAPAPQSGTTGETKPAAPSKPATSVPATTGPASSAIPKGSDWDLDFRPGPLRLYIDPTDGGQYWYFTYKVVNRTGRERMWAPRFEFFSDKGEIKPSGKAVPTRVTDAIESLLANPFLQDQNEILGDLLVGEEHAKEGLIVWPAGDAEVTEFTIFVTGASGKNRRVPDAQTGKTRVERWTLRFNYLLPGDAAPRGSTPVEPASAESDLKEGAERRPNDIGVWLWR
jgi:hypothetical protein